MINREDSLILKIEAIHADDGYVNERDNIIGKTFDAFITTSNTQYDGWSMVAGTFLDKTGIPELDNATKENPIVISIAKYSL